VHAFTPPATVHWEAIAVMLMQSAWSHPPTELPVSLDVVAVMQRPKRLLRAQDPEGRIPASCKPDWDNIGKIASDALEKAGVVRNDSQVVDGRVRRFYAARDEAPCVEMVVELASC
jgi:Holliday junction resolvase RusA-like endonuclease